MGLIKDFVDRIENASGISPDVFKLQKIGDFERGTFNHLDTVITLLYEDFDGQSSSGLNLFGEFEFLSLQQAQKFWREECEVNSNAEVSTFDKRLKPGFAWREGWFPFAWDDCFHQMLILDFDPSNHGTVGQVACVPSDHFIASNIVEFLEGQLVAMSATSFALDDDNFFSRIIPLDNS